MGIYSNGTVYGIRICHVVDDEINTLYETTFDVIMNDSQKQKAYIFYMNLNNKNDLLFRIYTECSSTYGANIYKSWESINVSDFEKKFNV